MKSIQIFTSACRNCRHFAPEGRRGGVCQQLGAPVRGSWKACSLAAPPFAPSWETLEDAWSLPDATPLLAKSSQSLALSNIEASIEQESTPVKAEALLS
ncbi:MAG: hypothetical protein KI793_10285 [Rivularia sp. (in: Bacteria)]|nr:hypothetical protein [Rivularia sp. MS3]